MSNEFRDLKSRLRAACHYGPIPANICITVVRCWTNIAQRWAVVVQMLYMVLCLLVNTLWLLTMHVKEEVRRNVSV